MSKYLPPRAVEREQLHQALRRNFGLTTGAYVYVRTQSGLLGTALKSKAEANGWTILSKSEFEAALNPKPAQSVSVPGLTANQEAASEGESKSEPNQEG